MAVVALLVLLPLPFPAPPQEPDPDRVSAERLRASLEELCAEPRLAGQAEWTRGVDLVAETFSDRLEFRPSVYRVFLPRQTGEGLEVLDPDGRWTALDLDEPVLEADPWQSASPMVPPMHGLTAPGTAEGVVLHAGRGTEADFAALRERHGELCDGAVALVRYGGLYRGLKVANAEAAGFAGALLYTDARDDGSAKGPVLPDGPWRPDGGIQRGSVFNGDGDALTPGWAATAEAPRLDPERDHVPGRVGIPSLPISEGNARRLLGDAPLELGSRGARVRMSVEQDPSLVEIRDLFALVPGAERPEEWVVFGAHRDSWGPGAVDDGTGTVVLMELARVLADAAEAGWRPKRTLVLASWDAEEWGLVGSTEWVEEHAAEVRAHVVAYVNMDVVASGPSFSVSATPGLWAVARAAAEAEGLDAPERPGLPGGGSDHVPFVELAGVEAMGFGFHGGYGAYHSMMDTPYVVERFLDPDFAWHAKAARYAVRLATLLGDDRVPVDGRRGWMDLVLEAAAQRVATADDRDEALALLAEAVATTRALEAAGDAPATPAWKLPRAFLPPLPEGGPGPGRPLGRTALRRAEGYGAGWFPDGAAPVIAGLRALREGL